MIFIDNKYKKWYFSIIYNAQHRILPTDMYVEKHHIIPKSMGGDNTKLNLVQLTAREHYICHLLLIKITCGKDQYKMIHAASSFLRWKTTNHDRTFKTSSRIYAYLKQLKSDKLKHEWKTNYEYRTTALAGLMKLKNNEEFKRRLSIYRKELWKNPEFYEKMKNRPKQYKKVLINGIIYNSLQDAGISHNITANNVCKRCKSGSKKFQNWSYI
jgi:hypothetical protein